MKRMKTFLALAIVCTLCLSILAGCGGTAASTAAPSAAPSETASAAPTDSKTYVLKFGTVVSTTHMAYSVMEDFEKLLEADSGGRIDVQLYANSQLGGEREMIEGMSMGTIEMFYGGSMTLGSFTEAAKFQSLPFLFTGGFDAAHEFFDKYGAEISDKIEKDAGVKVIWTENGTFDPLCNKEINTPADFKGLKMRCHEVDVMLQAYEALGAQAVAMSFSEIYTALQQGTIDGCNTTSLLIDSSKFYEQCTVFNKMNLFYDMGVTGLSSSWLASLPEDLQQLVVQDAKAFSAEYNEKYAQAVSECEDRLVNQYGVTIKAYTQEELAPFIEAVQPAYDWFRANVDEPNLDTYLSALEEINAKYMAS
jgi:tripartite ATP-independent transporter DctP family solute receptor